MKIGKKQYITKVSHQKHLHCQQIPLANMKEKHLPSNQNRVIQQANFTFFIAQKRPKKYLEKKRKTKQRSRK